MITSDNRSSQKQMLAPLSHAEWIAAAEKRYGSDAKKWRFRCPVCGHDTAVQDWKDAGASEGAVAFSCIGRYLPGPTNDAFAPSQKRPCNYAGGGLFRLNPIRVVDQDGKEHQVFDFSDQPLAPADSSSKKRRAA